MEEYYSLIEIVGSLLESGYEINFGNLEEASTHFNDTNNTDLLPGDFKIDRIYKCKESVYDSYITFVFAVSSRRYNFKGIVINALEEHTEIPIWDKFRMAVKKLKNTSVWKSIIKKQSHE